MYVVIEELLRDLSGQRAAGPHPSFTVFDLWKSFELIAERGSIGRKSLAEELAIGEGAIRTMVSRLKNSGMISTSKIGCSLTDRGSEIWKKFQMVIPRKVEIARNDLTTAPYNVAVQVRGRSERVRNGLEQRDAAVAVGGRGAVTLVFKGGRLIVPMVSEDLSKDYPAAFHQISERMKLEESDAVVIGGGENPKSAERGALAAAWTLI